MKYSLNTISDLVDLKNYSAVKLAADIDQRAFEVESVEPVSQFGLRDVVLSIETGKTNRVDALGHWGMAREIAAVTGRRLRQRPVFALPVPERTAGFQLKVNPKLCRKYAAWHFGNVTVKASPAWLQLRLVACGVKPINNVVDIANYVMLLTGQPLHAFDARTLRGHRLAVRLAKPREKLVTLDGETLFLTPADAVIADGERVVALAGIKGGSATGVTAKTAEIVLEAANFDPVRIRRTSWRVGLRTDAAHRFEKNLPREFVNLALQEAAPLLQELAGAKPLSFSVQEFGRIRATEIKLPAGYPSEVLGYQVPAKQIERLFGRLNFVFRRSGSTYQVKIPLYRPDLKLSEDLVEELGRLNGYENVPETRPMSFTVSRPETSADFANQTRHLLQGLGFTEVYDYSFYSRSEAKRYDLSEREHFSVANPLSRDQELMRISLLPNLLRTAFFNARYSNEFSLFEVGNVYLQRRGENFHDFARLGSCYVTGQKPKPTLLYLKGRLEALLDALHIKAHFEPASPGLNNRLNLISGENFVLGSLDVAVEERKTYAWAELDLDAMERQSRQQLRYKTFSRMPSRTLDLAVIVDRATEWAQIRKIFLADGLVSHIRLFDVYEGSQIPPGKKSIAFEVGFQDMNRTLSDAKVKLRLDKLISRLKSNLGAIVR